MRRVLPVILSLLVPVATGTIPDEVLAYYLALAGLVAAGVGWSGAAARRSWLARALAGAAAFGVLLAIADLLARAILAPVLYYRPEEMFLKRYPPLPLLSRFAANTRWTGRTHGDLSTSGPRRALREFREIRFAADAFGFPNDPESAAGPVDLVLLGDSYGVGSGTSQDRTWAHRLRTHHGFQAYNLSMPAASPWHEYVTLATEVDRLRLAARPLVVWAIFTGNDLDEDYYTVDLGGLPWMDRLGAAGVSLNTFRNRSPVRQIGARFERGWATGDQVVERRFVDGRPVLFYAPYVRRAARSLEDVRRHAHYPGLEATVGAMAALAGAKGLRVAVVLVPSKEEVYAWVVRGGPPWSTSRAPSGFALAARELAERHGLGFLDLAPVLIEASERAYRESGALLWWRDDTHWNDGGHAVAATAVSERLGGRPSADNSRTSTPSGGRVLAPPAAPPARLPVVPFANTAR